MVFILVVFRASRLIVFFVRYTRAHIYNTHTRMTGFRARLLDPEAVLADFHVNLHERERERESIDWIPFISSARGTMDRCNNITRERADNTVIEQSR